MKNSGKSIFFFLLSLLFLIPDSNALLSGAEADGSSKKINSETAPGGELPLTLEEAVMLVISQNLVIRNAGYDIVMSDSDLQKFRQKFAPYLKAEGSYMDSTNPSSGNAALFGGNELQQLDASLALSKIFSTGTTVSMGLKENYYDSNDVALDFGPLGSKPAEPGYYQPSFFISVQQELLKNFLGAGDRRMETILNTTAEIQRNAIVNQLSYLIVQTLSEYWSLNILTKAIDNAKVELETTKKVRDIISKNVRYGLADSYELNQYNSMVGIAETKLAIARQDFTDAYRKLLRTLNVDPETKVKNVTDLDEEAKTIDPEMAVQDALLKRTDYLNARKQLTLFEEEKAMNVNAALPSLTLQGMISTKEQNEAVSTAHGDLFSFNYPDWQLRLSMSYPLWNNDAKTRIRDSELKILKSRNTLEKLEKEIRDEVKSRAERVQLTHYMLVKQKEIRRESELYYNAVLEKNRRGKFDSVVVKNALDNLISTRQRELETIIQYNISLLQFDLSKNEIFEKYNIDIEMILSKVKGEVK